MSSTSASWKAARVGRPADQGRVRAVEGTAPYFQEGSPGRTWQDAAKAALVDKIAGMYFLGTFAVEQAGDAANDVGFFPFPLLGTEFDSENAIDAPIDGFMMSANPKNPEAAKAFLRCVGTPEAQGRTSSPRASAASRSPHRPTRAATTTSRRRPRRCSRAPATSPSSSTAMPAPTSPDRPACRAS